MRRLAAAVLILTSAGCASMKPTPGVRDSAALEAEALWKPGYAWGYRYETPRETGTFAWIMDREETLDGTTFYVMRSGPKDIYIRKSDFAYCMEKMNGEIVGRNVLAITCESSGPEKITVPAGTFETLKTTCTNSRTGELTYEIWYAVATRQMVRDRTLFSNGWRERELTDISLHPRVQ